jgi:putative ABC transport system substrate-binding protein
MMKIAVALACALWLLTALPVARAQQADKIARIGYLTLDLRGGGSRPREAFVQGMRDLGYVEGRNLQIEYRDAKGKPDQLPALAAELVALKVDVILASGGTLGALAAKRATATIPIVFPASGNPIADGLVASLARPGGNATGLSPLMQELIGKRLELLKQAAPRAGRVAILLKRDSAPDRTISTFLDAAAVGARALGLQLQVVEAQGPQDFPRAFADMTKARAGALVVQATPVFDDERRRLAGLAAKHRLPAMYSFRAYVDAGGLMSYGPDLDDLFRRAATYVDKIIKGAKPSDLPVEQPTKFEFVVNLKAAKALGVAMPPALLGRADQVIGE